MNLVPAERLRDAAQSIFEAAGVPVEEAEIVARSLVASNLVGFDSHGVIRIPLYVNWVRTGRFKPGAETEVLRETATTAQLDGHYGFGQVVARRAMAMAIEKARRSGTSWVSVRNCGHVGRLGEYPALAAEQGMIGMAMCNNHGGSVFMSVWGGVGRMLSPNPISFAIPREGDRPFLLDMTTSVVAEGKLKVARNKKERVPEGWIIDAEGCPTTEAEALYGPPPGAILPLGGVVGYKGFGLSAAIDMMTGALSGAGCSEGAKSGGLNGLLLGALDIAAFRAIDEFRGEVEKFIQYMKSSPRLPGVEEILVAGEPEYIEQEKRLRQGIPLDDTTLDQIMECAQGLGVQVNLGRV